MFPRYSTAIRLLVVPVAVFLLVLVIMLHSDGVDFHNRQRLPWKTEYFAGKKLQHDSVIVSTTPKARLNARGPTESPGNKTTVPPPSPAVNPHNFSFIINPSTLCSNQDLYMMIYVHTSPDHFRHRQTIRQTWANPDILMQFHAKIVFIIGIVPDQKVMNSILLESNRYDDIVQENFVDSYKNLTYKGIAALKWLYFHCNNIKYVLKSDDDMLVNLYSLVKQMKQVLGEQSSKVLLCNRWIGMQVVREKKSKWYVPKEEFALDYFPTYCSGSAFIMSKDATNDMFKASFAAPFFWVDDYYITGLLANKTGLKHKAFNSAYYFGPALASEKLKNDTSDTIVFYHVHNLVRVQSMWKLIEGRHGIKPNTSIAYYKKLTDKSKSANK